MLPGVLLRWMVCSWMANTCAPLTERPSIARLTSAGNHAPIQIACFFMNPARRQTLTPGMIFQLFSMLLGRTVVIQRKSRPSRQPNFIPATRSRITTTTHTIKVLPTTIRSIMIGRQHFQLQYPGRPNPHQALVPLKSLNLRFLPYLRPLSRPPSLLLLQLYSQSPISLLLSTGTLPNQIKLSSSWKTAW